jgi:hypothetical protein
MYNTHGPEEIHMERLNTPKYSFEGQNATSNERRCVMRTGFTGGVGDVDSNLRTLLALGTFGSMERPDPLPI